MSEVVLVRWPEEGDEGARLAVSGVAVLYLVDGDGDAPMLTTCLEDWVRIPGDDRDMAAHVAALELRASVHHVPPRIDDDGHLHFRGRLLPLSPTEVDLAGVLVRRFGAVVPDGELEHVVDDGRSLRNQMSQLRSRLRSVDLLVSRIRRQGYVLRSR